MTNGTGSSLGTTVEEELRIMRQLGASQATLSFLKAHGHGKRGRPRTYHKGRAATDKERAKAYRERQKAKRVEQVA